MRGAWCVPAPTAEGQCLGPPQLSRWGRDWHAGCAHVEDTVRLSAVPFADMPASSPDLGGCCKEITSSLFPGTGKINGFRLSSGTGTAGTGSPAQSKPLRGCAQPAQHTGHEEGRGAPCADLGTGSSSLPGGTSSRMGQNLIYSQC